MTKSLKIYVAGKVSKESGFGTHYWRDEFVEKLEKLSGLKLVSLDPVKSDIDQNNPAAVFGGDAYMISRCDVFVVYLSDDISVGGSQEILLAKYYKKPVIGLAPVGGKFNGSRREFFRQTVDNYRDPFVFTSCDKVCATIEEVAESLKNLSTIQPKTLDIVKDLAEYFEQNHLQKNSHLKDLLG